MAKIKGGFYNARISDNETYSYLKSKKCVHKNWYMNSDRIRAYSILSI